jgi:hypothetical protein
MSKNLALAMVGALAVTGWLVIALARPSVSSNSIESELIVGLVLGSMFGQVSLSAAWCALGPFPLIRRLPLSFLWLAAIVVSFGSNVAQQANSHGFQVLVVYGGGMLLQWLLVQFPIWIVVARYGLRVGLPDEASLVRDSRGNQFGIREIMVLTALVAVVLGLGRLMLGGLQGKDDFSKWRDIVIFAFLAAANAVISLPLLGSILLPRRAITATCGALVFAAFATALEMSLLQLLNPGKGQPDEHVVFAAINVFQAIWVLTVLSILRIGGFNLVAFRSVHASG